MDRENIYKAESDCIELPVKPHFIFLSTCLLLLLDKYSDTTELVLSSVHIIHESNVVDDSDQRDTLVFTYTERACEPVLLL